MTKLIQFPTLAAGQFIERPNRFVAVVDMETEDEPVRVHVPSPGRLDELLVDGARCLLRPAANPDRKTPYSLILVDHGGTWVCIDSSITNRAAARLLQDGDWPAGGSLQSEVTVGDSRFDFCVETKGRSPDHLLEVKSVNLVRQGTALFPDAPTTRGTRHVEGLTLLHGGAWRCHVLFVVQRDDARLFRPNEERDPDFSRALREAAAAGIGIRACRLEVTPQGMKFVDWIPLGDGLAAAAGA